MKKYVRLLNIMNPELNNKPGIVLKEVENEYTFEEMYKIELKSGRLVYIPICNCKEITKEQYEKE